MFPFTAGPSEPQALVVRAAYSPLVHYSTHTHALHCARHSVLCSTPTAVLSGARVLVLVDGTVLLFALDLLPLAFPTVRGVAAICRDATHLHRYALAKRRSLLALDFRDNVPVFSQDLPLPDGAVALARIANAVCVVDHYSYKLCNLASGSIITLWAFDKAAIVPLVTVVGRDEFLLVNSISRDSLGAMGVFVDTDGNATRGTILWSAVPKDIAFQYPYICALLKSNILEIHDKFSLQKVQVINLASTLPSLPRFLVSPELRCDDSDPPSEDSILIVTRDSMIRLELTPADDQITQLFNQSQIQRAVSLAESAFQSPEKIEHLKLVYQRAGLEYFKDLQFDESLVYLKKARIDYSLLKNLFPEFQTKISVVDNTEPTTGEDLEKKTEEIEETAAEGENEKVEENISENEKAEEATTTTSATAAAAIVAPTPADKEILKGGEFEWVEKFGTIHDIVSRSLKRNYPEADDETLLSFSAALVDNAKDMFLKYLEYAREVVENVEQISDIDTILLKLYSDGGDSKAMYRMLESENACDLETTESYLLSKNKYYAASLLYKQSNPRKVLQGWVRILNNEVEDPEFPGLDAFISYLKQRDKHTIMEFADHAMRRNPEIGARLFEGASSVDDEVVEYLEGYGRVGVRVYLESLVNTDQSEKVHTRLCKIYVDSVGDDVSKVAKPKSRIPFDSIILNSQTPRKTLLAFLKTSNFYNVHEVLTYIEQRGSGSLNNERAYLYSKKGEHKTVLRIFAEIGDYAGAQEYCCTLESRKEMFEYLVTMYLEMENRDEHAMEVLHLLNSYSEDFDFNMVVKLIPDHWSLDLVLPYFNVGLRRQLGTLRETKLVRALFRAHNLMVNNSLVNQLESIPPIRLTPVEKPGHGSQNLCARCGREINVPEFARLESGEIVHVDCNFL